MAPRRPVLSSILAMGLLAACGGGSHKKGPLTLEQLVNADPLPLAKGARWTYEVSIKRYDPAADKETRQKLRWTTEVTAVKAGLGITAYTVHGWPSDLASFPASATTGAPTATDRTLLRSGNQFLWGSTPEATAEGAEGWFTWPMIDGQKICPSAETVYCWTVAAIDTGYRLTYYTGPDEESYDLEVGTGVAKYYYKHHGTLNDVEAKLVSFSAGKK